MTVIINVSIELEHVSGPVQDDEMLLDAFAAAIGEQNGAMKRALKLTITDWDSEDEGQSVYKVYLVDAA